MTRVTRVIGVCALLAVANPVFSQGAKEAESACREAADLIAANDYTAALEEAKWCVESLQQMKQDSVLSIFPDTLDEFEGGELSNQSAMGITVLERSYQSDEHTIDVSYTGGVAGGGLAALAQLGIGLTQSSGKKMRVQKRTVINTSNSSGNSEYLVQLKSGGVLTMNSQTLDAEGLLEFVKAFPIEELDNALDQS